MSNAEPLKRCCTCGALLPLSCFHNDKGKKDGKSCRCKECAKKATREWSEANKERKKKNDSEYAKTDKAKKQREEYRKSQRGKEISAESRKKWNEKNPKKYHAQVMAHNAIRDGKLIKQPCEVCGREDRVHAHHCDYDKPLDVMWLCPICHRAWHNEHGEGANAHDEVLSGERIS